MAEPEDDKKAPAFTGEAARTSRRFQEQCFLMDNLEIFKKMNRQPLPGGHGSIKTTYNNFIQASSSNPQLFISQLTTSNKVNPMMRASPAQLSALVPHIKIFKVYYPTPDSKGEEYELAFNSHITHESLDIMTKSKRGRGSGVGVKSFDWKFNGSNPAESERLVEATLVLSFQNIDDLVEKQNLTEVSGTNRKTRKIGYLDLIHQENKSVKSNDPCAATSREYNEKYFRIKIQVGWAVPKIWLDADGNETSLDKYKKAIEQSGYTFFLTMVKHDLNFKEDGTIELTINYMAAMEGFLSDARSDILLLDGNEKISEAKKEIQKHKDEQVKIKNKYKDEKQREQALKELREDYEGKSGLLAWAATHSGGLLFGPNGLFGNPKHKSVVITPEEIIKSEKSNLYKLFLEKLQRTGGIFSVKLENNEIGEWTDGWFRSGDEQESEDDIKVRRAAQKDPEAGDKPAWVQTISRTSPSAAFHDLKKAAADLADDEDTDDVREGLSEDATTNTILNYIYLGAILETAFSVINENKHRPAELATIVGPLEWIHPRDPSKKKRMANLANIPISLNTFNMWFFDKCIAPQREKWLLRDFLQNLIRTLITGAISPKCFEIESPQASTRVYLNATQLPMNDKKQCRLTLKTSTKAINKVSRINLDLVDLTNPRYDFPQGDDASGLKFQSYLFMYANNLNLFSLGPPKDRRQTREHRDRDKYGIYHFRIGADRGLVKNIKFKKNDAPHIGAARISQEGPGILALRELYNADVEMFGNAIWKPGSIVFIDASDTALGASAVSHNAKGQATGHTSVSQALGLGGYYFITSANSFIESGLYKTELNCIWQASGTGMGPGTDVRSEDCIEKTGGSSNTDVEATSTSTPPPVSANSNKPPGNPSRGNTGNQSVIGPMGRNKQ